MVVPADLFSQRRRDRWWQRTLQFAPTRIVIGFFFLVPASALDHWGAALGRLAGSALLTLAFLGSLAAYALLVEGRRPRELSLQRAPYEWIVGVVVGLALLATTVGVLALSGQYRVATGGTCFALVEGVAQFAPHALLEEILLRALVFKISEEAIGSRIALVFQAAVFGAMHLGNPSATITAAVAIMLEAGLLLAIAYMVTRRIWFAWGIQFAWNYAQGSLFGIRVSGTSVKSSLLVATPTGADWITGGSFGVEASPIAVAVCVAASIVLWRIAIERAQVVGLRAQRERLQHVSDTQRARRGSSRPR